MSGWGLGWFGGGQAKKDAPKKAILQLRQQLELLNKREKHLHHQMEEQDALARKYVTSNKTAAKSALRRKKTLEASANNTSAQIITLEEEIHSIETANINKETLDAMKNAASVMGQIHKGMTVDQVDVVMDKIREEHAVSQEINEAITSGVGNPLVDEDELDGELEALQQEQLDEKMTRTGNVPVGDKISGLPAAPHTEVEGRRPVKAAPVEEDDEEAELRKLQAEMAI